MWSPPVFLMYWLIALSLFSVNGAEDPKETSACKVLPETAPLWKKLIRPVSNLWRSTRLCAACGHGTGVLSDYNRLNQQDERVKEVTNLGLTYNLLTAYTSFVAIDTRIRLKDGQAITVKQPLPLPQGVSDYAVGSRSFAGKGIRLATPSSSAMPLKIGKKALNPRRRVVRSMRPPQTQQIIRAVTFNSIRLLLREDYQRIQFKG